MWFLRLDGQLQNILACLLVEGVEVEVIHGEEVFGFVDVALFDFLN